MISIAIINGPNLNLLGIREPDIYGTQNFENYLEQLRTKFSEVDIIFFQSNIEGEILNYIQQCYASKINGIILNAAAYTHTSIAIADSLSAVQIPCIEVHISNVLAREMYRKESKISEKCIGSISGLGLMGYQLAIEYLLEHLKN